MVNLTMKTQKTEAQKGEVSCSKAHSKFMAELELEPQLIFTPHPSLQHDYKWQIHAILFPPQLTALLLHPRDNSPPGSDPETDTWSRSPSQGLKSVQLTSSHFQSTSPKPTSPCPSVMPLRKEHWPSHKVEEATGEAQGLGKCPWVGHSPLGATASLSMKGLIMSSLPAS